MLRLILSLSVILGLSACGTVLNPFNWFGNDRSEEIEVVDTDPDADIRPLVQQVVSLSIDPVTQGAIVRATGLPPTQGYWSAELIEVERTANEITYEFRVFPPLDPSPSSTQQSREVMVGIQLTNFDLNGLRRVTVIGAQNRRSVTRR